MQDVLIMPKNGDVIAVWFSNGAASAVAAKKTIEMYGDLCQIRILNNPVLEEDPDNLRFLKDCEQWLGYPIESVSNPKYGNSAVKVWDMRKYMAGIHGAVCTQELKKVPRQQWENDNHHDFLVLGFTSEERDRHDRFVLTERPNLLPILIDAGVTKQDCIDILISAGVQPPSIYRRGYPNANCLGCVKATSPTYWNHVRVQDPEVFEARAKQSRELGVKLTRFKGKRMFLDELPANARGQSLKSLNFECGIFCEESSK